jgi:CPA1 family monovalent cation:H+ antiporter
VAHGSGVLAVVSGGLFLSTHRHRFLKSSSRLRGTNVWESFVFILNGLVFMLIGMDLSEIISGLDGVSLLSAIGYGVLITAVLIIGRILSAYGAIIVTFIAKHFITVADPRNPGYRVPFVLGWTGMRGVVSLAAALSIPVQLSDGRPFPQRNLILFITFIVILLTLLIQGLTLPFILRKIRMPDFGDNLPDEEAEKLIRKELAEQALSHLGTVYSEQLKDQPALQQMAAKWASHNSKADNPQLALDTKNIYLDILNHQRQWLIDKNKDQMIDEEIIRKHLMELDLEEERMRFL